MIEDYINNLYKIMIEDKDISGANINARFKPRVRISGQMYTLSELDPVSPEIINSWIAKKLPENEKKELDKEKQVDIADEYKGYRFRINICKQRGTYAIAIRKIPQPPVSFVELGFTDGLMEGILDREKGLVIIAGPVESGKSTTLAACINYLISTKTRHIVTIEDPIEFLFRPENDSLVTQREVGSDVVSFQEGVRNALRQNVDVIMIGELRDRETAEEVLRAANTGHLVLTTLHTGTASETINRIVGLFSDNLAESIRSRLSASLNAIVCQRLYKVNEYKRVLLYEVLEATQAVKSLIRTGKEHQLDNEVSLQGHMTFKEQIERLSIKDKII